MCLLDILALLQKFIQGQRANVGRHQADPDAAQMKFCQDFPEAVKTSKYCAYSQGLNWERTGSEPLMN